MLLQTVIRLGDLELISKDRNHHRLNVKSLDIGVRIRKEGGRDDCLVIWVPLHILASHPIQKGDNRCFYVSQFRLKASVT